jgi:hypothetical protein
VFQSDVPVWPRHVAPYIVETIANNTIPQNVTYQMYLLTNYNSNPTQSQGSSPTPPPSGPTQCPIPVGITYIRLITDLTQLTPGLVDVLTYRMGYELAIAITEDQKKAQAMMAMYTETLNGAQAQLECDDSLQDEAGNFNWVHAGRFGRGGFFR